MNTAEYRRLYEAEGTQWWFVGMRAITFALLDMALQEQGNGKPLILDAGCGTGSNLEHLRERGRAVGIDLSDEALRFCHSRGVTVARAGLLELPFPDRAFDCVTSFDVLYHLWVEDDRAAVKELARVLRPGGLLLLRLPAFEMLRGAHDEAVHTRHRYTRAEVRRLLEATGLEVLRATYCNTLLLPLVALRRALDRVTGGRESDLALLPDSVEWAFRSLLTVEARILRRVSFPLGASIVALARVRGPAGASGYNAPMERASSEGE